MFSGRVSTLAGFGKAGTVSYGHDNAVLQAIPKLSGLKTVTYPHSHMCVLAGQLCWSHFADLSLVEFGYGLQFGPGLLQVSVPQFLDQWTHWSMFLLWWMAEAKEGRSTAQASLKPQLAPHWFTVHWLGQKVRSTSCSTRGWTASEHRLGAGR